MGIKDDELLDPGAVSETLKCPVCFEVFDDPVFCGGRPCQHVFCRICVETALENSEHCPSCRGEMQLDDLQQHQVIRSLLDEVPVRCKRACGWTGRRDALAAHADECPVARCEAAKAELALFADVSKQMSDRDARIAALEVRVAEQDSQVISVSRQLLARDVRIQQLEARLAKQDAEVASLRKGLSLCEAWIAEPSLQGGMESSTGVEEVSYIPDLNAFEDVPDYPPPPELGSGPARLALELAGASGAPPGHSELWL